MAEGKKDLAARLREKTRRESEAERRDRLHEIAKERYQVETDEEDALDALTDEGIEWLRKTWGEDAPECPYCLANLWYVAPPIALPTAVPEGGALFPMFPVICTNCGHTTFVSAVKAGIISSKEGEE